MEASVREPGGLGILVNNAGRQIARESIPDIRSEDFDETFKTPVYAMFWITKFAVPHMKPGATIINTASVSSHEPSEVMFDDRHQGRVPDLHQEPRDAACAQWDPRELGGPGPFRIAWRVTGGQPPDKVPHFREDSPMGCAGQPAELAGIYERLASPESSYSTRQVFAGVGGRGGP